MRIAGYKVCPRLRGAVLQIRSKHFPLPVLLAELILLECHSTRTAEPSSKPHFLSHCRIANNSIHCALRFEWSRTIRLGHVLPRVQIIVRANGSGAGVVILLQIDIVVICDYLLGNVNVNLALVLIHELAEAHLARTLMPANIEESVIAAL